MLVVYWPQPLDSWLGALIGGLYSDPRFIDAILGVGRIYGKTESLTDTLTYLMKQRNFSYEHINMLLYNLVNELRALPTVEPIVRALYQDKNQDGIISLNLTKGVTDRYLCTLRYI